MYFRIFLTGLIFQFFAPPPPKKIPYVEKTFCFGFSFTICFISPPKTEKHNLIVNKVLLKSLTSQTQPSALTKIDKINILAKFLTLV